MAYESSNDANLDLQEIVRFTTEKWGDFTGGYLKQKLLETVVE